MGIGRGDAILDRECWQGLSETVSLEKILERGEKWSQVSIWGSNVSGKENSKCKGPETGTCLACLRNGKKNGVMTGPT